MRAVGSFGSGTPEFRQLPEFWLLHYFPALFSSQFYFFIFLTFLFLGDMQDICISPSGILQIFIFFSLFLSVHFCNLYISLITLSIIFNFP